MEAAQLPSQFGAGLRSEIERRHPRDSHLAFRPVSAGYALEVREGPAPEVGADQVADGLRLRVVRVGRSPLPADRRRCAFLEEV